MSVRRGASAPLVGRRSSSRLDEVLRAGSKARTDADAEGSLTRTLKRTSLVPTGACLPRNFDPDYCAYDGYYAIGVGLVSATLGVIVDSSAFTAAGAIITKALNNALGQMCHTPKDSWGPWSLVMGKHKQFHQMYDMQKIAATEDFGSLCNALNDALYASYSEFHEKKWWTRKVTGISPLAQKLSTLIALPSATVFGLVGDLVQIETDSWAVDLYLVASVSWTLKYISRYMNEHALMVASFFRVNAKRLRASEPLLTDLKAFAQQCKEDIADGPNPPPPPPTAEELAAARAEAEAQRQRMEERDPLMDGIDYPPSIGASACK